MVVRVIELDLSVGRIAHSTALDPDLEIAEVLPLPCVGVRRSVQFIIIHGMGINVCGAFVFQLTGGRA